MLEDQVFKKNTAVLTLYFETILPPQFSTFTLIE